tara:strand:+ start:1209 stop:1448 length:240 start_codon:yes stop_codon:yes gene_type:complete
MPLQDSKAFDLLRALAMNRFSPIGTHGDYYMNNPAIKIAVIIFAIIGVFCVLGFIAMWFMHGGMMMDGTCPQAMGSPLP